MAPIVGGKASKPWHGARYVPRAMDERNISRERLWVACATGRRLLLADGTAAVVQARPVDVVVLAGWLAADRIVVERHDGGSWPGPWDHEFAARVLALAAAAQVGLLDHRVIDGGRSGSVRRERPELGWAR